MGEGRTVIEEPGASSLQPAASTVTKTAGTAQCRLVRRDFCRRVIGTTFSVMLADIFGGVLAMGVDRLTEGSTDGPGDEKSPEGVVPGRT